MCFLALKSLPVQRPPYSYCFIFLHWMTSKPWINTSNQHFQMDFYPPRKPANLKRQKSFCATFSIYFYIIGAHFPRQQVVAHCQIHPLILQLPMVNNSKHPEEELCFDKYQSSLPKKTIDLSFAPRILAHLILHHLFIATYMKVPLLCGPLLLLSLRSSLQRKENSL